MTAHPAAPDLPTVVIGGYLGAGKTTLLNHLLRHAGGRRITVLVNDFGDVNIDADLIVGADAGVLSLAGGCLCCTFGDDLVGTLTGLHRRDPPPDLVLIELSGVALPAAVLRSARLALGIHIVGTLVVVDAAHIRRQAGDRYVGDTVRQQLCEADWLLVNKTDLIEPTALGLLIPWLSDIAPGVRLMACQANELPAELVLGWPSGLAGLACQPGEADETGKTGVNGGTGAAGFACTGLDPDAAALARFGAGFDDPLGARLLGAMGLASQRAPQAHRIFESLSLPLPPGTDLAALGAALAAPDSGVLRAKGLLAVPPGVQGPGSLLQVAGGRWQVQAAQVMGEGRLVLIGLRGQLKPLVLPWAPGH